MPLLRQTCFASVVIGLSLASCLSIGSEGTQSKSQNATTAPSHDSATLRWHQQSEAGRFAVRGACFSPDGKTLITGWDSCLARAWRSDNGAVVRDFSPASLRDPKYRAVGTYEVAVS